MHIRRLLLITASLALFFVLGGTALAAKQYLLKRPSHEHCKSHYVKKAETVKKHEYQRGRTLVDHSNLRWSDWFRCLRKRSADGPLIFSLRQQVHRPRGRLAVRSPHASTPTPCKSASTSTSRCCQPLRVPVRSSPLEPGSPARPSPLRAVARSHGPEPER
jgi:hypothetical protein